MSLKIYFSGSISGGRQDHDIYGELMGYLKSFGEVLTEEAFKSSDSEDELKSLMINPQGLDKLIFDRDIAWLKDANAVVAEVSTPSLGVGYEIGQAEAMGLPILGLYRPQEGKELSAMIAGNDKIIVKKYGTASEAFLYISEFMRNVSD